MGLLGLAVLEAPALSAVGEEAGLLSFAARSGGQRLLLWGAAHPVVAVELVSAFVGVGTAVNSWDEFVQALQDPREAMFLLMQVAMELMHLHQARGPRPTVHHDSTEPAGERPAPLSAPVQAQIIDEMKQRSEVTVHRGAFTPDAVGAHLVSKAQQQAVDEIYIQINSAGASRELFLGMLPTIRRGYAELAGKYVRVYGGDGQWWEGFFHGMRD